MELQKHQIPNCTLKKSDVFLVYDDADSDRANIILETLNNNGIQCCTTGDFPGKNIITIFKECVATVKKVVLIYSTSFAQNELLNFGISIILFKFQKKNIITIFLSGTYDDNSLVDEFQLVHHTIIVRTKSDSWLDDLVRELNTVVPSYINVKSKGDVINSLMFQGLLIEHMQSDILGILIMADKLCLQVDLKEYLKHQKQHREYKTATAIKEFRNLCDIDSTVIIVLKDGVQEELQTAKEDVAVLASAVMDTSIELTSCSSWFVACTIKGKYTEKEQRFLNGMHNSITCTLIEKCIESVKKPVVPEYENITERIQSYPLAWREEDLEAIQNMSDAGFFYPGYGESGRCFHCGSFLANIRARPMLLIFHSLTCPSCRYIENKLTKDEIKQATAKFRDKGNKPKEAELLTIKYQNPDARRKSFESYEKNNGKVSDNYISDLVEAGFYYFGSENLVHCFSCSVRICGIPNDQNVWSVHANLSPACSYVKTKKGGTFLCEQKTAKEQTLNADCTTSITFIMKTMDGTTRREWPNNMIKPC
jgi:hypothetical protein